MLVLRPFQSEDVAAVIAAHAKHRSVLGRAATGCHAKGQIILMFDGSRKKVEDIVVGDWLMGADNFPRIVMGLAGGRGKMVRIVPTKGDSWIVNEDHILSLQRTNKRQNDSRGGEVVDVSVKDWRQWSKTKRHVHKLFRVPADFPIQQNLPLDPYFLGVLLGDGSFRSLCVTGNDASIHREARRQAKKFGLKCRADESGGGARITYITTGIKGSSGHKITHALRSLGLGKAKAGTKFIPEKYKLASRSDRLAVLAGLIDTDGSYYGGCFDYISKSEVLSNDVAFIARSLGLAAYVVKCRKQCQNGNGGDYYRVCISGDISEVPCRLKRKMAPGRLQKKDHRRTGFKVEDVGDDDYFGFTLSGDGRYLLGDFTVTHNTGKGVVLAYLAKHYSQFGRVMVLVDMSNLVRQLAETITEVMTIPPGIEMGDERSAEAAHFLTADRVVVSTVQTQYSGDVGFERYRKFNPGDFSALLLDETELFLAPKARQVVEWYKQNPALRIFGCSATPMRTDGVAMAELFEHVAFDRDILWGIDQGYLVNVRQAFVRASIDFSKIKAKKNEDGEADYSDAEVGSAIVEAGHGPLLELAQGIIKVGGDRKSIVVAPTVEASKVISDFLDAVRPGSAQYVSGAMGDDAGKVMKSHRRGDFQYLCSCMLLCKGYNDPTIQAVFNCRKTKSKRLYHQVLGRATRPHSSIVDAINAAPTAAERRAIIAASVKPWAIMGNLVGVGEEVRDVTILDILGTVEDQAVLDRAKDIMADGETDSDAAVAQAEDDVALDRDVEQVRAEEAAAAADEIDEQQAIRRLVQVEASVDVEYQDDLRVGGGEFGPTLIPDKQMTIFRKAKLSDKEIAKLKPEAAARLCQEIVGWWRTTAGCTYKQGRILRRSGYAAAEILAMTFEAASGEIDAIAKNNWRRAAGVGA